MAEKRVSRVGVLLAAIFAIASLAVMAQSTTSAATSPATTNAQAGAQSPARTNAGTAAQNNAVGQTPSATRPDDSRTDPSSGASNTVGANQQLPQTSTILPLLGLIGLGSLVAGLFARR